jgi:hypothetical protein
VSQLENWPALIGHLGSDAFKDGIRQLLAEL